MVHLLAIMATISINLSPNAWRNLLKITSKNRKFKRSVSNCKNKRILPLLTPNMESEINAAHERDVIVRSSEKSFGIVMAIFFGILSGMPLVKGVISIHILPGVASLTFLSLAFLLPEVLRPLNIAWFKFGLLLQRFVSPIILGVIFFGVFTPMGMILRLFSYDPLQMTFDRKRNSYWVDRDKTRSLAEGMKDQF